jgi:putative transcriptional regulator
MKFETLEAICAYLQCQPGDILEYAPEATPEREQDEFKRAG